MTIEERIERLEKVAELIYPVAGYLVDKVQKLESEVARHQIRWDVHMFAMEENEHGEFAHPHIEEVSEIMLDLYSSGQFPEKSLKFHYNKACQIKGLQV